MAVFSGFSAFWPGKNDFHEFSLFLSCFPVKNTSETVKTHRFYDFVLSGPTSSALKVHLLTHTGQKNLGHPDSNKMDISY